MVYIATSLTPCDINHMGIVVKPRERIRSVMENIFCHPE
jgi:hypothetical protein